MKRWTLRIFVFLVLGAIVNVAVAWEVMLTADVRAVQMQATREHVRWWKAHVPSGLPTEPTEVQRRTGLGRETVLMLGPREINLASWGYVVAYRERSGWPWLAMEYSIWRGPSSPRFEIQDGFQLPWRVGRLVEEGTFPCRLVWPGFAINTAFHAVVVWLLVATAFTLRRQLRLRRGLCSKCAYDLRGTRGGPDATACPECGTRSG